MLLYRTLATLRTDVDLGVTFEEMEYRGAHQEALASLSEELGLTLAG